MKRVAIAAPVRFSVFSSGMASVAINMYDYLKEFGLEPVLLNTFPQGSTGWYDDCSQMRSKYTVEEYKEAESVSVKYDILIDIDGVILGEKRRAIAQKVVVLLRKPTIMNDVESIVYPANKPPRYLEDVDAVWVYDHFSDSDIQYIKLLAPDAAVSRVPFLWRPTVIDGHYKETGFGNWNPEAARGALWHPHVMETNMSNTSSCVLPMVIFRQLALKKTIDFKEYTIHNMEQLNNSDYFRDNIKKNTEHENLKPNFIGRQRVVDLVVQPKSCLVSHLRFLPFRPILLDALWVGIPVVHNSVLLRNMGCGIDRFYYRDNEVLDAVQAFKNMDNDFTSQRGFFSKENQLNLRRKILETFGGYTEEHRGAWLKAVSTVINDVKAPETASVPAPVPLPVLTPEPPKPKEAAPAPVPVKTYNILFTDMWDDFNAQYNFFLLLLNDAAKQHNIQVVGHSLETIDSITPDLVIYGPFGETYRLFSDVPKVHFTGENTDPIQDSNTRLNLGYSLLEKQDDSYMRIPLWLLEIDWFGADHQKIVNPKPLPVDRVRKTYPEELQKHQDRFCAFVVTNPMNPVRNDAFYWLSQYKQVDSAGRLFNNIGDEIFAGRGGGGGELKKHEFLKKYKFCLCFENQSAEGYTTEKLMQAKAAGCIPIYWGDPKVSRDFNEAGFINAQNIRNPEDLISLVRDVDQNREKYEAMYKEPLLDDYRFQLARRRLGELARRIWNIMDQSIAGSVPQALGAEETPAITESRQDILVIKKSYEEIVQSMVLVTYATSKFLNSLQIWIQTIQQFKTMIKGIEPHVYLGDDVEDHIKEALEKSAPGFFFHTVSYVTYTVQGFDDFWAPEHFAWKLWLLNEIAHNSNFNDRLVFYTDCGAMMTRIPFDYIRATMAKGICFLEDPRQTNRQWCHTEFCNALQVSEAEKTRHQIWAGGLMFLGGAPLAAQVFEEALKWGSKRNIIAGPKWSGVGPDGKPYGHRHDQSILSIVSLRLGVPYFPLDKVYNGYSMRRTFRSGSSLYVHRGNFTQHKEFLPRISEAHVINLKRRGDRLERFNANHPTFGDRVVVDEACDGRALHLTPTLARLFAPNDFHWKKAILGCAMSHLKLWLELSKEDDSIENYLIMEDDVKFRPDWERLWAEAVPHIPEDYDVLYLGGILPPNRGGFEKVLEPVNNFWSRVGKHQLFGHSEPSRYFHVCNYAYILSKKAAKKILERIMATGGYYTSADHMICNQVDIMNHYFLNPLVAGSYQDDDPKYANSDFNNFSRIDGFDSDLWNNDERFTEEERRVIEGVEPSFEKAVEDAFQAEEISSVKEAAKNTLVESNIPSEPIPKRTSKHFYTVGPHKIENVKDIMELQWLHDLIDPDRNFGKNPGDLSVLDIVENLDESELPVGDIPPIFIVQRPYLELYSEYFKRMEAAGKPFYAWHISDEYSSDDISWYNLTQCKGVVRNYIRSVDTQKVCIIPLGYSRRTDSRIGNQVNQTPSLPFRELVWSFRGTGWQGRVEKLGSLQDVGPNLCEFYDDWKSSKQAGRQQYVGELLNSKFVPCPGGMNPETFRFYEALEMGAIPLYVRCEGDDNYFHWIVEKLKILGVQSWPEARVVIQHMLEHPDMMDKYRFMVLTNWMEWKKHCGTEIRRVWNL